MANKKIFSAGINSVFEVKPNNINDISSTDETEELIQFSGFLPKSLKQKVDLYKIKNGIKSNSDIYKEAIELYFANKDCD